MTCLTVNITVGRKERKTEIFFFLIPWFIFLLWVGKVTCTVTGRGAEALDG